MNFKFKASVLAVLMSVTIYGNSDAASIPEDASRHHGHHYKVYNFSLVWNEAEEFCENMGGHLVTITSDSEQRFVHNLILERGHKEYYWLGGYRTEYGTWRWITAEQPVYSNWAEGQPDNYRGIEDVLMMYRSDNYHNRVRSGQWNDTNHNSIQDFGFVCEWESRY